MSEEKLELLPGESLLELRLKAQAYDLHLRRNFLISKIAQVEKEMAAVEARIPKDVHTVDHSEAYG